MWTLQGFLDYFFLESEVEGKTGSITALLYTEQFKMSCIPAAA